MANATEYTKIENGNSKLTSPQTVLQVSNFDLRLSAGAPPKTIIETGNSKLAAAPTALPGSTFTLRPSAGAPQTIEIGNSKLNTAQLAPQVSAPSAQDTKTGNANSQPSAPPAPQPSNPDLRPSPLSPRLTPQQLQFLLRVSPGAVASQDEYGIPACVTIAQAILESATAAGWGSSVLFRLANNPFGIKYCHFKSTVEGPVESPQSKVESQSPATGSLSTVNSQLSTSAEDYGHFDAQTWEIENGQKKVMIAEFQRFPNLQEAFRAHALLLCSPHYRPAFAVRDDWKQFAERLGPKASPLDSEHCGYSTNPSYSAELSKLVSLYRLTDPRALQWFATGKDPGNLAIGSSDHRAIGSLQQPTTDPPTNHEPMKSSAASG